MTVLGRAVVLVLLSCSAFPVEAQTPAKPIAAKPESPKPASPKPAPLKPDPAFEAAKAAFEAWPEAERRAVQDALVWTGEFNGVVTGGFGRRTYDGLLAYGRRTGLPGGVEGLDRSALIAAGEAARRAAGFRVQADPASGATIGVPEGALPRRSSRPGGTRWQSADGRVTLDTRSFPAGETSLDALFERAGAASPERKVTYTLRKPDFFVVAGETAAGRFYIRYAAGPAGIRGFSLGTDKAAASETDRLVIAIANSFVPFPEGTDARPVAQAAPVPPAATRPKGLPPVRASGLLLSPTRVLTSSTALEGCRNPRIGEASAQPASRGQSGALLLKLDRTPGGRAAVPLVRAEAPAPGEPLLVIGADAAGAVSVAPATAGPAGIAAPLQPGAGGAPVLDRSGRLVGLVLSMPAAPRLAAGVMPPGRYALVPGSAVSALSVEARIDTAAHEAGAAGTPMAAAAPVLAAVVAIRCED